MDAFQEKVYTLTEKLNSLQTKPIVKPVQNLQIQSTLDHTHKQVQNKIEQLQQKYENIMKQITKHAQNLTGLQQKNEERLDIIKEQYETCMENSKKLINQHEENIDKQFKKIQCQAQENANHQKYSFELKIKLLKKQIQQQFSLLCKQLINVDQNPQKSFNKLQNNLYKQYYAKLLKIQQNEKRKVERINEMEKNVKKRISILYQNILSKITQREKDMKNRYQKMKRLFALITDIS